MWVAANTTVCIEHANNFSPPSPATTKNNIFSILFYHLILILEKFFPLWCTSAHPLSCEVEMLGDSDSCCWGLGWRPMAKGGDAESQVRVCDIEEVEGRETDSGQRWDDAALMPASATGGRWEGMEGAEEVGATEPSGECSRRRRWRWSHALGLPR
jgi:hypothetical protein